jgi:tetratricopeptide (TPR) repeat protein
MSDPAENLQRQAAAFHRQGRYRDAIDAYRRLLALKPELTDCWYDLGYLLKAEGEYDASLEAYGEALARGVKAPEEVHLNRAVIYADHLRRDEAAEWELRAALGIDPEYLPALLNLGNLQEERGQREEALATYDRLLAAKPGALRGDRREALRSETLARLAHLRPPAAPDDPMLGQLEAAAANVALDHVTRANLLFALGRACDKLARYDQAFSAFAAANRHARLTGPT